MKAGDTVWYVHYTHELGAPRPAAYVIASAEVFSVHNGYATIGGCSYCGYPHHNIPGWALFANEGQAERELALLAFGASP